VLEHERRPPGAAEVDVVEGDDGHAGNNGPDPAPGEENLVAGPGPTRYPLRP
jgi:hypothetical protein